VVVAGEGLEGDTVESGGVVLVVFSINASELPDHDGSVSGTGEENAFFVFFGAGDDGGDPIVVADEISDVAESGG